MPRATDLKRPGPLGLPPAKVELSSNRQAHEEPVAEAEVVDEQENILHSEVDKCHGALVEVGKGSRSGHCQHQATPGDSTVQQAAPDLLRTAGLASLDYLWFFSVTPRHQIGPFST